MIAASSLINCPCGADFRLSMVCLICVICRWTASLLGLMMVLKPKGTPLVLVPVCVFPTGFCRMENPKNSKPTFLHRALKYGLFLFCFVSIPVPYPLTIHSLLLLLRGWFPMWSEKRRGRQHIGPFEEYPLWSF